MTLALQNEKAFTRIEKVYGDAAHGAEFYEKELKSLQRAFVELSNHFGVAQQDALNIAADWAAAGASGLALAKSVKLTMETMVLGELEAVKATKSLIAIQAQYGLSIDELTDAIGVLNMVENQTGASMADLIDGFTRAAGVARSAGVSVEELAADIAALTPATGTAANAGNALKTIFSRLMSPTKEVNDALNYMGIQINNLGWQGANAQQKLIIMAQAFEKLSDSEKGMVASTIATRYQVNRFEILMAELVNQHGYYARAIESTADKTAVFKQAQSELNKVLTSSPQRLKIIWTQLQNAATDIIQPLIPLLLYLATAVKELVSSFSELNPAVQKFILFSLALLAAVGPLVRYLGALQVLIYELSKIFRVLLIPLWLVRTAFQAIAAIPLWQMLTATGLALRTLGFQIAASFAAIPAVMAALMSRIRGIIVAMIMILRPVITAFLVFITSSFRFMSVIVAVAIGRMARVVVNTYFAMLLAMQNRLLAFAALSGRLWRLITLTPLLFFRQMWAAIIALGTSFLPAIRALSIAVWTAMTGPWGIAIGAAIALVVLFWDDIKEIWSRATTWIAENSAAMTSAVLKAFYALPQGVQNALLAVARVVRIVVMKVAEWLSYLNPWARHSPSLVDNVTTGVAAILQQYSLLSGVGSTFSSVIDDLKLFEEATKAINRSVEANKYAEIREDLVKLAADAVGPFDRLVEELYGLEDQLKAVGDAMDAQETVVDALKNELNSANDALDAQKDILRQMKEEADGYEDVINRINGDLEVLTGTREALRDAGAGSDILGQYDDQIRALEEQKGAINDQLSAAEQAYKDQEDLVNSLTAARDALQASYDLENAKLKELRDQYDAIADRIRDITQAINDFATSAAALAGKKGSNPFEDVIPADYADVGGSGQLGREGGLADQSAEIDAFAKELADKTKNMFGMFDFLEPVKKAWGKAKDWMRENIKPIFSIVGDGISEVFGNLPNPFAKMNFGGFLDTLKDVGKTVGDFFKSLWDLIGPPLKEIRDIIGDALQRAFKELGPELAKFKDLVGPIGDLLKQMWEVIKPLAMVIGGVLLLAIKVIIEVLANSLGPILNFIIDVIKGVIKILRGLIEFIVGVFTGNWELAWTGIKDFFGGLWDIIWSLLKNAVLLIWGIIKGLVEGIVGFFTWLWDVLVGHSIIPDMINAILFWFDFLWKGVQYVVGLIVEGIKWAWENMIKPVFDAWGLLIQALKNVFSLAVEGIKVYWDLLISKIQWAWQQVQIHFNNIKNIFYNLRDTFWNIIDTIRGYIDIFVNRFNDMKNKFSFSGLFDGIKDAFKAAVNWIIGKWNNLEFKIGGGSFMGVNIPSTTIGTPNLQYLAKGDVIDRPTLAMIGEGRRGFPEFVIPTDPAHRARALELFALLSDQLGVNTLVDKIFNDTAVYALGDKTRNNRAMAYLARGGAAGGPLRGSGSRQALTMDSGKTTKVYNFYGDLSFPNVRDGSDVEEFLKNLEALMDD